MKILVTGATGNVGGAAIRALLGHRHEIRALTRNPGDANLPAGVYVVAGHYSDRSAMQAAIAGMDAVHLINLDSSTGGAIADPGGLVGMMRDAGVRRVTTFRGFGRGALEAALEASGLEWTDFFIPVEFSSNALHWAKAIREEGRLRIFGSPRSAVIHIDDIGTAVAKALVNRDFRTGSYTLTGPEVLEQKDMAEIIGGYAGQTISVAEMSEAEARRAWGRDDVSDEELNAVMDWYRNPPSSAYTITDDLRHILGRQPRSFSDWARDNAAHFVRPRDLG